MRITALSTGGYPINYGEVSLAALRSASAIPGIEGIIPTSRCTSRLVVGSIVNEDPGGGPLSLWCQFRLPASLATNAGVCGLSPSETHILGGSGSDAIGLAIMSGDLQLVMGNSSTYTRYALGVASLVGQVVDVVVTRSGSTLAAYVNGTPVTLTAVNVNGSVAPNAAITGTWAHALAPLSASILPSSNASTTGPVHRFVVYNRALSASEASLVGILGVDALDQWGSSNELMNAATANGSFNNAGSGGADAFAIWSEGGSTGATVYDTTVTFAPGASCRFDVDANPLNSFRNVFQNGLLALGKRYRIVAAFRHNKSGDSLYPYMTGFASGYIPQSAWTPTSVAADAWQEFSAEFMATSSQFSVARAIHSAGAHSQWYDEVRLIRVGAIIDLQFDGTCGAQAADRANQRDATLFDGTGFTLPDAHSGFCRWIASVPAGERIGGGAGIVIPNNCYIDKVVVRNINIGTGRTFSLGSSSGSLTDIVSAVSLNGNGSVNVIDPGNSISTTGQLWISYTGAGSVEVSVFFRPF